MESYYSGKEGRKNQSILYVCAYVECTLYILTESSKFIELDGMEREYGKGRMKEGIIYSCRHLI